MSLWQQWTAFEYHRHFAISICCAYLRWMKVFMDFEASSLNKQSYPVEIAWVFEDGRSRTFLIRPASVWNDWSAEAEAVHGISRDILLADGIPVETVTAEMMETLADHELYASSPSWDGKWMSVLLRAAGHPRHALRLGKSDDAFLDAARVLLRHVRSETEIAQLVTAIIQTTEPLRPAHRALPDAVLELRRLELVRERAASLVGGS